MARPLYSYLIDTCTLTQTGIQGEHGSLGYHTKNKQERVCTTHFAGVRIAHDGVAHTGIHHRLFPDVEHWLLADDFHGFGILIPPHGIVSVSHIVTGLHTRATQH